MRKLSINSLKRAALAILVVAIGGAHLANAQPEQPPAGTPERVFAPGRGALGEGTVWGVQIGRVLTDEQRGLWREIMQAQRDETTRLLQAIRQARRAIVEATLEVPFDERAIRKHAQALAKAEAELAILRAKALGKIKPPLTPEQREQLKTPPRLEGDQGQVGPRPRPQRESDSLPPLQRAPRQLPPE